MDDLPSESRSWQLLLCVLALAVVLCLVVVALVDLVAA
jgi:hypothetical protein